MEFFIFDKFLQLSTSHKEIKKENQVNIYLKETEKNFLVIYYFLNWSIL